MIKGLVIKDFLALKSTFKSVLLILVMFSLMGQSTGGNFTITMISVYMAILPISAMAYDERAHFNRFALTTSVSKNQIILSKYIFGALLSLIGVVIGSVISLVFSKGVFLESILINLATALGVAVVYQSLIFPLMFHFGTEKARIFMMAMFFIPTILIMFLAQLSIGADFLYWLTNLEESTVIWGAIIIGAVLYSGSILISLQIGKNKEW